MTPEVIEHIMKNAIQSKNLKLRTEDIQKKIPKMKAKPLYGYEHFNPKLALSNSEYRKVRNEEI